MELFVGISRNREFRKREPGSQNFWCVAGQSLKAQPGDLLLLYLPVSASPRFQGIGQIYRITSEPRRLNRSQCAIRGMAHIDTELLLTLERPVTAKEMKIHPVVRRWNALSRNFQGVTFAIPDYIWKELRLMILERNPQAATLLYAESHSPIVEPPMTSNNV